MSAYIQILLPIQHVKFVGNPVIDYLVTHGVTDTSDTWYREVARRCKEMYGLPKYTSDDYAIDYGFDRAHDQMYINTNMNKFISLHEMIEGTNIFRYQCIDLNYLKYSYADGGVKDDPFIENGKLQIQKIWNHPCVVTRQYSDGTEFRSIVALQPEYNGFVCYKQGTFEFNDEFLNSQMFYIGTELKDIKESLRRILNMNCKEAVTMYDYFVSAFSFYTEQDANPILKVLY